MTWLDYVIIGIIVLSALLSLIRGFVREALSLGGWLLAFWVGLSYAAPLSDNFLSSLSMPPALRVALGFTLLFAATIALATLVNYLAGHLITKSGLTSTDRAVGMLFGIARGCVIVAVLVVLGNLTAIRQESWWSHSVLVRPVHQAAVWMSENLVPGLSGKATSG